MATALETSCEYTTDLKSHEDVTRDAVYRSRELYLDEKFDDAHEVIQGAFQIADLSDMDRICLLRAEARLHMSRGYPQFARQCIANIFNLADCNASKFQLLCYRIHLAFVTIVGCGEKWDDEVCLQDAQNLLTQHAQVESPDMIELASHVYRIAVVRETVCLRVGEKVSNVIAKYLRQLIEKAAEGNQFYDVWQLICVLDTGKKADEFLERLLLQRVAIPDQLRALMVLEHSKSATGRELEQWLRQAEVIFKARDNKLGLAEVHGLLLVHGFETVPSLLKELIDNLNIFIQENCPRRVLGAAMRVLTLALEKGSFSIYVQIQEVLYNVSKIAGVQHENLLLSFTLLANMNITSSRFGATMELAEKLYNEAHQQQYWTIVYYIGQIQCLALLQAKSQAQADDISLKILEICKKENLQAESMAWHNLAVVQKDKHFDLVEDRITNWRRIHGYLEDAVSRDMLEGELNQALQKICLIVDLQLQILPNSPKTSRESTKTDIGKTLDRARSVCEDPRMEEGDRILILGKCDEARVRLHIMAGAEQPGSDEHELEGVRICHELIETYLRHSMKLSAAMKLILSSMCQKQRFQKASTVDKQIEALIATEGELAQAVVQLESIGSLEPLLIARHSLAEIYVTAWDLGRLKSENVFPQIEALESIMGLYRQELSVMGSLSALTQKHGFSMRREVSDLYRWAIAISILSRNGNQAWMWSQKRKARSLADLLGIGIIMPEPIKSALVKDADAKVLFDRFNTLASSLTVAAEDERMYIRQHISDTELQLSKYASFQDFLALRDGAITGVDQTRILASSDQQVSMRQREVLFVDYLEFSGRLYALLINASQADQEPLLTELPITLRTVERWVSEYFTDDDKRRACLDRDSLRDAQKPLRALDGLVTHLQQASKPGDLLIFCPTSKLSVIPLHALKILHEGRNRFVHLIKRNPVIYAPSFTVLNLCLTRSLSEHQLAQRRSVFMGVFDKPKEAETIYQHLKQLAKENLGQEFSGKAVTKASFTAVVQTARVVHYHGHCEYNMENILQQALILSESCKIEEDHSKISSGPEESVEGIFHVPVSQELNSLAAKSKLSDTSVQAALVTGDVVHEEPLLTSSIGNSDCRMTVEEIFRLRLCNALVVLIACQSAAQTISPGDEPLGLISGLMCSGAATVIGALWPIPSGSGRLFSEEFYAGLRKTTGSVVDLAVVLQNAVLKVMDKPDTSSPYHWGAFSLFGSWILQLDR